MAGVITLYLYNKKGYPIKGKVLTGVYSAAIFDGSVKSMPTGDDGRTIIEFSSSSTRKLKSIHIGSKTFKSANGFIAGSTHSFQI